MKKKKKPWINKNKVTDKTFVKKTNGKDILLYFHAPWCGPCYSLSNQYMEDVEKQLKIEFPDLDLQVLAVDVSKNVEITESLGIKATPHFCLSFANAKIAHNLRGAHPQEDVLKWVRDMIEVFREDDIAACTED